MATLTAENAIKAVRKNLDEQQWNPSTMYGESKDNIELDHIIAHTLPEAIDAVNREAPAAALETIESSFTENSLNEDGVLSFHTTHPVLRLIAMRAADSNVVLGESIPENSPNARMQLNRYVRGTSDNPVLVLQSGTLDSFKYYSVQDPTIRVSNTHIAQLSYITFASYDDSYDISSALITTVIDKLTSMVLAIYGDMDKANYFNQKANIQNI